MKSFLCRYLLVYKHSSAAYSLASNRVMMFINRNRMVLLLVAYVIMLALIGKFIFFSPSLVINECLLRTIQVHHSSKMDEKDGLVGLDEHLVWHGLGAPH